MNYEELYYKFLNKWKRQQIPEEVYTEKHHIIPKHCGGSDEDSNLVVLTYRQHTFAHRLLWKAFGYPQDRLAWKLMSSIEEDKKFSLCQMAGTIGGAKNKESGHMSRIGKEYGKIQGTESVKSGQLDAIRHLANNEAQLTWASKLGRQNVESGQLDIARSVALDNLKKYGMSEKRKEALHKHNEKMKSCPKAKDNLRKAQKFSVAKQKKDASERAKSVLENAERNEEYLNVTPRGKYWYISPEGFKFGTSIAAANYYGCVKDYQVQNWCRKEQHGWRRELVIR